MNVGNLARRFPRTSEKRRQLAFPLPLLGPAENPKAGAGKLQEQYSDGLNPNIGLVELGARENSPAGYTYYVYVGRFAVIKEANDESKPRAL